MSKPILTQDMTLKCPQCQDEYTIGMPCPIYLLNAIIEAFARRHDHQEDDGDD